MMLALWITPGCGSDPDAPSEEVQTETETETDNSQSGDQEAKRLFERVLIIGASVSNDAFALSPGKLVAKQARVPIKTIYKHAKDGQNSSYHTQWLSNNLSRIKPSIVFGLDLFEQDVKKAYLLDPITKFRVKQIVDQLCATADDVYIGNTMPFGLYLGPMMLNNYLAELQKSHSNLHIIDVQSIYAALYVAGYYYNVDGVKLFVTKKQALKDSVHPNQCGSTLLANILIQTIRQINPQITKPALSYLPVTACKRK